MFNRQIFRQATLDKISNPEELNELLRVNPVGRWIMLTALLTIVTGLIVWSFLGSITRQVSGFGVYKTGPEPHRVLAPFDGQVDSVFVRTGDKVAANQKLAVFTAIELQNKVYKYAPFDGEISAFAVKVGDYTETGELIAEIIQWDENVPSLSEIIFYVEEKEVISIKKGMEITVHTVKGGLPPGFLHGTVTFVSPWPAPLRRLDGLTGKGRPGNYHEVRAALLVNGQKLNQDDKQLLRSVNGLQCSVDVLVSKEKPASRFFQNSAKTTPGKR